MTESMLLLDINVWLDYYFTGRAGHQVAFELVKKAIEKDCPLLVSSSALSDFFYITELILKRECQSKEQEMRGNAQEDSRNESLAVAAWAFVEHLLDTATVVGSDSSDAWIALKYRAVHNDFEDNLVIAAAQRSKAAFLITNDAKLLRHSPVAALSPADWMALQR